MHYLVQRETTWMRAVKQDMLLILDRIIAQVKSRRRIISPSSCLMLQLHHIHHRLMLSLHYNRIIIISSSPTSTRYSTALYTEQQPHSWNG